MKLLIIFVICVVIYGVLTKPSPPCQEETSDDCKKCCRRTDQMLLEMSKRMKNNVNGSYNSPIKNCNTCKIHVPNEAFERSDKTCESNFLDKECPAELLTVKLFHVNVTCTCKFPSENKKAQSGLMNIVWQQDPEVTLRIHRCSSIYFNSNSIVRISNYAVVNPVASVDILSKCEGSEQFIKKCMIFAQSFKNEDMEKHVLSIAQIYFPSKKLGNGVDPMNYDGFTCPPILPLRFNLLVGLY